MILSYALTSGPENGWELESSKEKVFDGFGIYLNDRLSLVLK